MEKETAKRGLFIAFEGIDGCGKTTQVWKLAKHLSEINKHNHVIVTREPWKNQDIRKILRAEDNPYSQGMKLASMFITDRKEHVAKMIAPNLQNSVHVISDRYSLSTLAYQHTQGIPLSKLLGMHGGLPIPDIIFIVDVPAETALKRMKKDKSRKKGQEQKFEKSKEFIEKLRKNYLGLAHLRNHRIIVIDGGQAPDKIFEKQIKPALDKIYNRMKT